MAKHILISVIVLMSFVESYGQNFFKKEELKIKERSNLNFPYSEKRNSIQKYYKIKFSNDKSELGNIVYPIVIKAEEFIDTINLIKDLLSFEGDTCICVIPIKNYNTESSQVYMGELKDYSIQVEALFIINQLYFKQPFYYSPYPLLRSIESNKEESIDGEIIKMAYVAYKQWFKKVEEVGISEARNQNITPLDGYPIKWYK